MSKSDEVPLLSGSSRGGEGSFFALRGLNAIRVLSKGRIERGVIHLGGAEKGRLPGNCIL